MIIKQLNIAAFGGLKNKKLDLSKGFNVIYGDNEKGKTTVMSFIKMMFYGSGRGSSQISKNIRKKYTPWDGSNMAGSIDFELSGKSYRLEREFKSSDSTDKITLIDLALGTREAVGSDIGVRLLGLSSAAFERSVFIGSPVFSESDSAAEGEINSRLSNIATSGEEDISYNTVNDRIMKAKNALMSKSGRAGEYDKAVKSIAVLEERLQKSDKIREEYDLFKEHSKTFRTEMAGKASRAAKLKAEIDREQDIKNAEKLKEMLSLKERLDAENEKLRLGDGSVADEMFIRKLDFCMNRVDALGKELEVKRGEAERLEEGILLAQNQNGEVTPERLAELDAELKSAEEKSKALKNKLSLAEREQISLTAKEEAVKKARKGVNIPLLTVGIIALLAVVGAFAASSIILAVAALTVGAVLVALSFVLRPKDTEKINSFYSRLNDVVAEKERINTASAASDKETSELRVKYESLKAALNTSGAMLEHQKNQLTEIKTELSETDKKLKTEQATLIELFGRYKKSENIAEIKAEREKIALAAEKIKEIKTRLTYITKDVGNISYEDAAKKLSEISALAETADSIDRIKAEYEDLITELTAKKEELTAADAAAEERLKLAENPEILRREIALLKEKTARQAEFCKAADIASEVLGDAFAELRSSYGSALEKRAAEIFSGLTGGNYEGMQISKSFDISVEKSGVFGSKELAFLSAGTTDQAYLSLRLALSELIFENAEALPILLDDPFIQCDDSRTKEAVEFLSNATNPQTVMFTCHRAIYDTASDFNAVCNEL